MDLEVGGSNPLTHPIFLYRRADERAGAGRLMKRHLWQILLAVTLLVLSAALYLLHFSIFRDAHHIAIYLLGDIAFLPLEVLLVTVIIHRLT